LKSNQSQSADAIDLVSPETTPFTGSIVERFP